MPLLRKCVNQLRLLRTIFSNSYSANMSSWQEDLNQALRTLKPREEKVIRLRFGIDNDNPQNLEEVGKIFGVTRTRIREIEARAIRKLRTPSRRKLISGMNWQSALHETRKLGVKMFEEYKQEHLAKKSKKENVPEQEMPSYDYEVKSLPTRIYRALVKGGYKSISEIQEATDRELKEVRNIGVKSLKTIREVIG